MAFFIQLALTKGAGGDEILPVLWSDNYFSLAPGESRELTARIATRDLAGHEPALEAGGWNIETRYRCGLLKPSKFRVKAGEPFTVRATISNTFLDGSRVALNVDGRPADARWAWARGDRAAEAVFPLTLPKAGTYQLEVASQRLSVIAE